MGPRNEERTVKIWPCSHIRGFWTYFHYFLSPLALFSISDFLVYFMWSVRSFWIQWTYILWPFIFGPTPWLGNVSLQCTQGSRLILNLIFFCLSCIAKIQLYKQYPLKVGPCKQPYWYDRPMVCQNIFLPIAWQNIQFICLMQDFGSAV